jgi:hypothetical protein
LQLWHGQYWEIAQSMVIYLRNSTAFEFCTSFSRRRVSSSGSLVCSII